MKLKIKIENLGDVQKAIEAELAKVKGPMSEKFMTIALGEISAHTAPYVPVDTSDLINSEYRKVAKSGNGWSGEIGYSADYAGFVHDGGPKNWQKEGASDEFLFKGASDFHRDALSRVIAAVYK